MSDPSLYTYPSPLEGWENLPPLPNDLAADGKSFINPPSPTGKSPAYTAFPTPITNGPRGGFDVHVYYLQTDATQAAFAAALWERVRREFPELRIYRLWERPVGPHATAMFEVNLFTPEQFGAFVPWLVVNRGPLSALLHPNTDDEVRDHSQRATWLGERLPVNLGPLRRMVEAKKREKEGEGEQAKV
ncbi:putative 21.2 kDa protein [Diplodia seriata]|uniref:Putative 21.2 kDa protein n=1 Tax=Diplodia seriata TaxID=420778 RepID=A0A1S8BC86_9PEZI|nr:putative 21.2 kDa protein [Diplodia seriata]